MIRLHNKKLYMQAEIQTNELTNSQQLAIKNAGKKSKIHQKNLHHLVVDKFIQNNINIEYIDKITNYIRTETSLTTKMPSMVLDKFLTDPILKNRLELYAITGSYGDRSIKEDKIFNDAYKDVVASERVKYGSLNLKNLISGDPLASSYGDTTIFYKNDMKKRTTFLYGNSCSTMMYICTFEHCEHLLYHMPIKDINILINIVDGVKNDTHFKSYVEIQLHGTIDITRDVEKFTISNDKYLINKTVIDKFINKYHNIDIIIY